MTAPDYFASYSAAVSQSLAATKVTGPASGDSALGTGEGLERAVILARRIRDNHGTLFFCGNGASSAMAGHMALDWLKAGGLRALSFNDPAILTAVANDTGYENTFSLPIHRLGSAHDLLVTISSSGNSPNVVGAIESARKAGMSVVTFSGFKPDNRSRQLGDLNFFVPCRTYGIAECCHQILLHAWLDRYLGLAEWETPPTA